MFGVVEYIDVGKYRNGRGQIWHNLPSHIHNLWKRLVKTPQNFVTEVWPKRVKNWILIKGVGDPTPTEIGNAIVVRF